MATTKSGGAGAMLVLALLSLAGCKTEATPTQEQLKEQRQLKSQAPMDTPKVIPGDPNNVNEAQLVLNACGKPASEAVMQVYSHSLNGPVLRMVYEGRQPVTLEFVPSRNGTAQPESTPLFPRTSPGAPVSPNTTWEFNEAWMGNQALLTSSRLALYLPCAARALRNYD